MNSLHIHDIVDMYYVFRFNNFYGFNRKKWIHRIIFQCTYMFSIRLSKDLKETMIRPLKIEDHSYGSDPLTHKKVKETVNHPPANTSTNQSGATANFPTPIKSQTDTKNLSEDPSKSSMRQQN